ncbi:MAG: hypothetical protein DMG61_06495 [Acidobacteria bacterium]|nr:MAG: hypothetical protein DMG61_06495 [Acidobacteriota bacterium]PYY18250.1 MAG: hypothetical protein DMG60_09025 [Acidobacteriota bacterium]
MGEICIFWAEFDDFEIEFETPLFFSLFFALAVGFPKSMSRLRGNVNGAVPLLPRRAVPL